MLFVYLTLIVALCLSTSCSEFVARRSDRRDSGIDTFPEDHKWWDRSVNKFLPTAKFTMKGGKWEFVSENSADSQEHDEL
jgi:hypothetical protein